MSIDKVKKAKIIYDRLYEEYGNWKRQPDFAREFGVTRQQIYTRKTEGKWDEEELKRIFPEINMKWLKSEKYEELYELPVKAPKKKETVLTNDEEISNMKRRIAALESGEAYQSSNQKEVDNLLQSLQDHATSFSQDLQKLIGILQ